MDITEKRFWQKVEVIPGHECWEWSAYRMPNGYGKFKFNDKEGLAHRASWEIHFGPIPEGLFVCHHCDNPGCVRPDHLFLGTPQDNVDDMYAKGRDHRHGATHCGNGLHEWTEENICEEYGRKRCRPCMEDAYAVYYEANRDALNAQKTARYTENREEILANIRSDRAANPGKYRAWERAKRAANPDKYKARDKRYYDALSDEKRAKRKDCQRAWQAENREHINAMARASHAAHRDERNAKVRARRAAKKRASKLLGQ